MNDIILTFAILLVVVVLFIWNRIPVDLVATLRVPLFWPL
jgi:hypothetical protein